ncbi:hypothetical protein Xekk_03171 [Xenorhabdus sp. KK7.4]|nr:hypothetical protein Xekk_03171 [Xenorhabdus sp. KK7.4]
MREIQIQKPPRYVMARGIPLTTQGIGKEILGLVSVDN